MDGVSAPFRLIAAGVGIGDGSRSSVGEADSEGVDISLQLLEPRVAATEGEEGGSGDRVKYTTLARDPPIYMGNVNVFSPYVSRDSRHARPPQCAIRARCDLVNRSLDYLVSSRQMNKQHSPACRDAHLRGLFRENNGSSGVYVDDPWKGQSWCRHVAGVVRVRVTFVRVAR
jgi:hypothetical protein